MKPEPSNREIEVISCAANGMDIPATATYLKLAQATVKKHRARAIEKVKARDKGVQYVVTVLYQRGIFTPDVDATPLKLPKRQRSVLIEIAKGYTNEDIGRHLYITENTVKIHVGKLLKKFGAANRAHMVYMAFKTKTLTVGPPQPAAEQEN